MKHITLGGKMSGNFESDDKGSRLNIKDPENEEEFLEQEKQRLLQEGYPVEKMKNKKILRYGIFKPAARK